MAHGFNVLYDTKPKLKACSSNPIRLHTLYVRYTELYENTSKIQIHYQLYTSSAYSSKDNVNMQQSFKRLKLFRALLDLE